MNWLEGLRYTPAAWLAIAVGCLAMAALSATGAVICATAEPSYPAGVVFGALFTIFWIGCMRAAAVQARNLARAIRTEAEKVGA